MSYIVISTLPLKGKTYKEVFIDRRGMRFAAEIPTAKVIMGFLSELHYQIIEDVETEICFGPEEIKALMPLIEKKVKGLAVEIPEVREGTKYSTNIFGKTVFLEARNRKHDLVSTLMEIYSICQDMLSNNGKLYITYTKGPF